MSSREVERRARRHGQLTIEQHDERMNALIAQGEAVAEPEAEPKKVVLSGVACPACGFRLMDIPGTSGTDPDGAKFRQCGCFRCGAKVWRRTP